MASIVGSVGAFAPPFCFLAVQQRVNIAGLRMLSLEGLAYQIGPECPLPSWLGSRTNIKLSLNDECGLVCLGCANSMFPAFSLESGILVPLGRGCLCDQPCIRSSGIELLLGFPWQKHCTHIAAIL